MASSSNNLGRQRQEDIYEQQNDQRLDELHSKIRNLRGVTTDIYDDVERQHLTLDDTGNTFDSFRSSLAKSSQRAAQAFGLNGTGTRQMRIIGLILVGSIGLWLLWKIMAWFFWSGKSSTAPTP